MNGLITKKKHDHEDWGPPERRGTQPIQLSTEAGYFTYFHARVDPSVAGISGIVVSGFAPLVIVLSVRGRVNQPTTPGNCAGLILYCVQS